MRAKLVAFLQAEWAYVLRLLGMLIVFMLLIWLSVLILGLVIEGHWIVGLLSFAMVMYVMCRLEDRL